MKKLSIVAALVLAVTLGFLIRHRSPSLSGDPSPSVDSQPQAPVSPSGSSASLQAPGEPKLDPESSVDRARTPVSGKRSPPTTARKQMVASTPAGGPSRPTRNLGATREANPVRRAPSSRLLSPPSAEERVAKAYADFFAKYAIDPATQAKIIDLIVERDLSLRDILDLSRERGLSVSERDRLVSAQLNQDVKALEAVLGKGRTQALLFNGASRFYQPYASEFTNRCAWQGVAVTPDVAELVGRTTALYRPIGPLSDLSIADARAALISVATRKVGSKLTPAQLEVFKQMLADQLNLLAQQSSPGP